MQKEFFPDGTIIDERFYDLKAWKLQTFSK